MSEYKKKKMINKDLLKAMSYEYAGEMGIVDNEEMKNNEKLREENRKKKEKRNKTNK